MHILQKTFFKHVLRKKGKSELFFKIISVIGRNVYIGKGSVIENCVILQNTVIGSNVMMNHAITDKGTLIDDSEEVKGLRENPVVIPKKRVV